MLHDYWLYRPDSGGLARWVPHTRGVIDWYAAHQRPDGLLGRHALVELRGLDPRL